MKIQQRNEQDVPSASNVPWKLTSSVKMACPVPAPGVDPYIVADICVLVEGFNLDNKNRAWLLPWSQTMYLGTGNQSTSRSWASATGTSSNSLKFSYPSLSWYPWFCHWATSSPWKMKMWKKVSSVMLDGHTIEKYWHRRSIESVRHKSRLNHNKRVVNVLYVQSMTKIIISLKFLY